MRRGRLVCENAVVTAHSPLFRALAGLLASLLALPPAVLAAPPSKTRVVVIPYAPLPGVPEAAAVRATELLTQELREREELQLGELPKPPPARPDNALAQAKSALAKATELAKKDRHVQAAESLQKAISLLAA